MAVSSCLTPRAIWVTTGDCPPMIPRTANFPTSCSRFSGKCSRTAPKGNRCLLKLIRWQVDNSRFCSTVSIAPPSAVAGLFVLPVIPRWAEFPSPPQLVGNHRTAYDLLTKSESRVIISVYWYIGIPACEYSELLVRWIVGILLSDNY